MSLKIILRRKIIILFLMATSIILPVIVFNLHPIATRMPVGNVLTSSIGYIGIMLLLWQYLLGVRFLAAKFVQDLVWINNIHKNIGIFGTLLIFAHPIPVILQNGPARYFPNFDNAYSRYIFLGQMAMLFLASTWFASALLRKRMSFRWWKRLHLLNYSILPLVLLHSLNVGTGLLLIPFLNNYFKVVALIYVCILILRVSSQFGFMKFKSKLVAKAQLTPDVMELEMLANEDLLQSLPGQFLYVQTKPFGENHPFTIARVNRENKTVSIMPKNGGPFSGGLHELALNTNINIDGPYGVFTREVDDLKVPNPVFIAGGIGITPFIQQISGLTKKQQKFTLFYANKSENDIVLRSELESMDFVSTADQIVHVISSQPNYIGEQGYITSELIQKYLGESLLESTFFICGPKPMMKAVKTCLKNLGVEKDRIFAEEFSL